MKPGDLRQRTDGGLYLVIKLYDSLDCDGCPDKKADVIIDGQFISMSALQLKYTTRAIKHGTR